jgi:type II secretory pathway pseudopilin PulG
VSPRPPAHAFTLVELLFTVALIALLIGLLIAGVRYATRSARRSGDTQTAAALKMGVEQFRQQFGFFPPLVKDLGDPPGFGGGPLGGVPPQPRVYSAQSPADVQYLRTLPGPGTPDVRFSVYALAYYVVGALDANVDGKAGPGFTLPSRDGVFARRGATYGPYFDTGRNARAVFAADPENGRIELRDAYNTAYRYYRWLPDAGAPNSASPVNNFLNVPVLVGDPETQPEVRGADYAIIGAGPDGLFGDEMNLPAGHPQFLDAAAMRLRLGLPDTASAQEIERRAREDNVVEVGR